MGERLGVRTDAGSEVVVMLSKGLDMPELVEGIEVGILYRMRFAIEGRTVEVEGIFALARE